MISPSDIPELIDAYLDGDLGAEAIAQLKAWLEADDAHIGMFAQQVFLHQQLREAIVAENAANCLQTADEPPPAAVPVTFDDGSNTTGGFWTSLPAVLLGVLVLIAVTGVTAYQLGKRNTVARLDHAPSPIEERAGTARKFRRDVSECYKLPLGQLSQSRQSGRRHVACGAVATFAGRSRENPLCFAQRKRGGFSVGRPAGDDARRRRNAQFAIRPARRRVYFPEGAIFVGHCAWGR